MIIQFVDSTEIRVLFLFYRFNHFLVCFVDFLSVLKYFAQYLCVRLVRVAAQALLLQVRVEMDLSQVEGQAQLVPWVVLDFFDVNSLYRVRLQHLIDQVPHLHRDEVRHIVLALFDLAEELRHRFVVEWKTATDHGYEEYYLIRSYHIR